MAKQNTEEAQTPHRPHREERLETFLEKAERSHERNNLTTCDNRGCLLSVIYKSTSTLKNRGSSKP